MTAITSLLMRSAESATGPHQVAAPTHDAWLRLMEQAMHGEMNKLRYQGGPGVGVAQPGGERQARHDDEPVDDGKRQGVAWQPQAAANPVAQGDAPRQLAAPSADRRLNSVQVERADLAQLDRPGRLARPLAVHGTPMLAYALSAASHGAAIAGGAGRAGAVAAAPAPLPPVPVGVPRLGLPAGGPPPDSALPGESADAPAAQSRKHDAAGQDWQKRHMHLMADKDGVQMWIRDAEAGVQSSLAAVQRIAADLAGTATPLRGATVNGRLVYAARDRSDTQLAPTMFQPRGK